MSDVERPILNHAHRASSSAGSSAPYFSIGDTIAAFKASQPKSYRYSPLTEKDSIRLLQIQPADEVDDDLHLAIIHTALSAITTLAERPLAFTALSYFWGPQLFKKPVYIRASDGERMLYIGANLHSALCHLRSKVAEVVVWADGLCIDQCNVKERNHQVHQMRAIYERASKTVVYLGDEGGNTCLSAWNFLEREAGQKEEEDHVQCFRGDLGDVEIDVLTRPWFRRVWVVQEIAVSKNIVVQCGTQYVTWDNFCRVVLLEPRINDRYGFSLQNKYLYEYVTELFLTRCAFNTSRGLLHLLPSWHHAIENQGARSDHILDMVVRSRSLEATDPRDKVFAMIGISSGVVLDDPRIAVDYSKPLVEVYADFTHYLMERSGNLDILSYAELDWGSEADWPSWVPDWRLPMSTSRSILSSLLEKDDIRERMEPPEIYTRNRVPRYGRYLQCSGTIIGRIWDISSRLRLRGNDELEFEQIRQKYRTAPHLMNSEILNKWKLYPWSRVAPTENSALLSKHQNRAWDVGPSGENYVLFHEYSITDTWRLLAKHGQRPFSDDLKSRLNPRDPPKRATPHLPARLVLSSPEDTPGRDAILLSSKPQPWSIMSHLINRSRQTLLWTDDESMAVETVADKSSIIDNRRLGLYEKVTKGMQSPNPLLLVPDTTVRGDLVVVLEGAKVPCVVRLKERTPVKLDNPPRTLSCELIGECLLDDHNNLDMLEVQKDKAKMKKSINFLFEGHSRRGPLPSSDAATLQGYLYYGWTFER